MMNFVISCLIITYELVKTVMSHTCTEKCRCPNSDTALHCHRHHLVRNRNMC